MRKRFKFSNLQKFLGHEAVSSEVVHSHAYGKVARSHRTIPRTRHAASLERGSTVASYKDSMVGSTIQYRDNTPLPTRTPEKTTGEHQSEGVIGNRPHSRAVEKDKADKSIDRRHHFVEPPKRNFRRFD